MCPPPPESDAPTPVVIAEVRYSLPALLAELKIERANSTFAMERLDQSEIGKLFKAKPLRRVKPKK
ncbi:MAG: hypothetical protein NTV51_31320 [Verrucomicrobia bacterium]|nr:hypothetical protein [Verrucomicrobiota bacterium]